MYCRRECTENKHVLEILDISVHGFSNPMEGIAMDTMDAVLMRAFDK